MINENAIIQNVSLSEDGYGSFDSRRIEFDIITGSGEFHFNSGDVTPRELDNVLARLFQSANDAEVGVRTLFNELLNRQLHLTVFIEISQ